MKKYFTLFTGLLLGACVQGNAQIILEEDFESTTGTDLPATWTHETAGTDGWKTASGKTVWISGQFEVPAHTRYAVVNDYVVDTAANDTSMLISPSFDLSGVTGAYLAFNYYFIGARVTLTGTTEEAHVYISSDDGATWTSIKKLAGANNWTGQYLDLSNYSSATTKVAFGYFDKGERILGVAVDDIKVWVPFADDARLDSIILPHVTSTDPVAANGALVNIDVFNNTGSPITSLDIQYSVDGGTAVTETKSGLNIPAFTSQRLSFSTALSGLTANNTSVIDVEVTMVNSNADGNPADNMKSASFFVPSNSTTKPCLIEEFTSSTCAPCASFNTFFDPLIEFNNVNQPGSNFNIIKYQMNWPQPGNDRSYNQDGYARRVYYGVSSIPDHLTQGAPGGNGSQQEIDDCKANNTSFISLEATYTITEDSLFATVDLTPFFTLPVNHSLHVATVEDDYVNNFATTSQKDYIHVMRELLTGGTGQAITSYTDGSKQQFTFARKYSSWENGTEVKQNSRTFWTHPMNSHLVVFVQDNSTKQIMQSVSIAASWPTSVAERTAGLDKVALYPNPATAQTNVLFTLENTADVQIQVVDAVGRTVFVKENKQMTPGSHTIELNTDAFAAGLYNVRIQTENGAVVKRLSVVK